MGGNVCEVCREGTDRVPLCLYTVENNGTLRLCPNCAERIYRRPEVFKVDREGEVR